MIATVSVGHGCLLKRTHITSSSGAPVYLSRYLGRDRLREPNWRFTLCTARSIAIQQTLTTCYRVVFAATEHL